MKREIKEETNLDIKIISPLHVQHFIGDDGQKITMIIFLCNPLNDGLKLSEEYFEFSWTKLDDETLPEWLKK